MQPYFLPYIGYFQLMAAVDAFVVYDNIKFTKSGWINRNRLLLDGRDTLFSLPIQKASDALDVVDRSIAEDFELLKVRAKFATAYAKSPGFVPGMQLVDEVLAGSRANLFEFLHAGLRRVRDHLGITAPIIVSSTVPIDHGLKGQRKVLALCEALGASTYLNAIGGLDLYGATDFASRGIALQFLKPRLTPYPQACPAFVPALSIIDVLMHVPMPAARAQLDDFDLIEAAA